MILCYDITMFTGLIEKTAEIKNYTETSNGAVISVDADFAPEVKIGDSISVNGACLTVIKINGNTLSFEISKETLKVSNFNYKKGQLVNLERAMSANSRFDGHIVSGHIDGVAKISKIIKDGFSYNFEFMADDEITKYIVKKGSVTVNGISLTLAKIEGNVFNVEIIPHTIENTNFKFAKVGDIVNIETDILARYIEKFLYLNKNDSAKSKITIEMLKENGF